MILRRSPEAFQLNGSQKAPLSGMSCAGETIRFIIGQGISFNAPSVRNGRKKKSIHLKDAFEEFSHRNTNSGFVVYSMYCRQMSQY